MEARHFNIGCGEALIGEEKWRRPTTSSIDSSFGEEDLRFAFCVLRFAKKRKGPSTSRLFICFIFNFFQGESLSCVKCTLRFLSFFFWQISYKSLYFLWMYLSSSINYRSIFHSFQCSFYFFK